MTPSQLAEEYVLSRDISPGTTRNYQGAALRYEAAIPAGADPWDYVTLNRYLVKLKNNHSPVYHNSQRRLLIALWRFAAKIEVARKPDPSRIRLAKETDRQIGTFSIEQVRQIRLAATQFPGFYRMKNGISRAAWWTCFVSMKWDTGLRHCDVHQIRHGDINSKGVAILTQSKTGKMHACQFSLQTLADIDATRSARTKAQDLILPWAHSQKAFYTHGNKIIRQAGIPEGNMKWLRASAGTAYENENPGRGHELLGNDRATFNRFYRDICRLDRKRPQAPEL